MPLYILYFLLLLICLLDYPIEQMKEIFYISFVVCRYVTTSFESGQFSFTDIQTLLPLRNGHIYMRDAECAEANEKSIFRFIIFELLSFLYKNRTFNLGLTFN